MGNFWSTLMALRCRLPNKKGERKVIKIGSNRPKSDDPEATRIRIEEFTKRNQLKGTITMIAFSAAVLSISYANPYVP